MGLHQVIRRMTRVRAGELKPHYGIHACLDLRCKTRVLGKAHSCSDSAWIQGGNWLPLEGSHKTHPQVLRGQENHLQLIRSDFNTRQELSATREESGNPLLPKILHKQKEEVCCHLRRSAATGGGVGYLVTSWPCIEQYTEIVYCWRKNKNAKKVLFFRLRCSGPD